MVLEGYCKSLMYFCMASSRCGMVVVGWYVGTVGGGICGTEHANKLRYPQTVFIVNAQRRHACESLFKSISFSLL